jgi:NAD(P)-dependent dehydrogenase (short-subunit alcohol dehydrogenase family)
MSGSHQQERPSQYYDAFVEELPSMKGKTVVVTGCSRGLGYVTALTLAKKGASVIMLNRNSTRADEARRAIAQVCSGPSPLLIECDLLDFESVRKAANTVKEKAPDGVDVLCCNAGIMLQPDEASKDGYDITASTNMLSHFLLTRELMPSLEMAASSPRGEARIVTMSSGSGYGAPAFNPKFFEKRGGDLGGPDASYERYHQSKLANLAFTSALERKLRASSKRPKSSIMALACTPGVCGTDMFIHATTVMRGSPAPRNKVPSTEDGSLAQLKCICDPSVVSGELWGPKMGEENGQPIKVEIAPPTVLVDEDIENTLWKLCEQAVGTFDL